MLRPCESGFGRRGAQLRPVGMSAMDGFTCGKDMSKADLGPEAGIGREQMFPGFARRLMDVPPWDLSLHSLSGGRLRQSYRLLRTSFVGLSLSMQ